MTRRRPRNRSPPRGEPSRTWSAAGRSPKVTCCETARSYCSRPADAEAALFESIRIDHAYPPPHRALGRLYAPFDPAKSARHQAIADELMRLP